MVAYADPHDRLLKLERAAAEGRTYGVTLRNIAAQNRQLDTQFRRENNAARIAQKQRDSYMNRPRPEIGAMAPRGTAYRDALQTQFGREENAARIQSPQRPPGPIQGPFPVQGPPPGDVDRARMASYRTPDQMAAIDFDALAAREADLAVRQQEFQQYGVPVVSGSDRAEAGRLLDQSGIAMTPAERRRLMNQGPDVVKALIEQGNVGPVADIGSPRTGPEGAPLPVVGDIPGFRTLPEAAATIGTAGIGLGAGSLAQTALRGAGAVIGASAASMGAEPVSEATGIPRPITELALALTGGIAGYGVGGKIGAAAMPIAAERAAARGALTTTDPAALNQELGRLRLLRADISQTPGAEYMTPEVDRQIRQVEVAMTPTVNEAAVGKVLDTNVGQAVGERVRYQPEAGGTEIGGLRSADEAGIDTAETSPSQTGNATRALLGDAGLPESGLTDRAMNLVRRGTRVGVETSDVATPIMRQRKVFQRVNESRANRLSQIATSLVKRFDRDKTGRIVNLPGQPTIQDVAARLPAYRDSLTPEQVAAFDLLRRDVDAYHAALIEQGVEIGTRADVMEGGFYLPRGRAAEEGADAPMRVGLGGGKAGGKKGFERSAVFDSMSEGIDAGYKYAPFEEAMRGYATEAGQRVYDANAANLLENARDEAGNLIGQTQSMRLEQIAPGLHSQVTTLRNQIRGRIATLRSRGVRASMTERQATRESNRAEGALGRTMGAADRVEAQGAVDAEAQASAREVLRGAHSDATTLGREMGQNVERLRQAKRLLTPNERQLLKEVDALNAELGRARQIIDLPEGQMTPGKANAAYNRALTMANRIERRIDRLTPRIDAMSGKVDDLIERGGVLKDMDAAGQQAYAEARRTERAILRQDRSIAATQRELRILEMEQRRAMGAAGQAWQRSEAAATRFADTEAEITRLRGAMDSMIDDYRIALDRARQMPRGQASIGFYQLQGRSFPEEVAAAANKELAAEAKATGAGAGVLRGMGAINMLYRGLRSTLDASYMGVQGLLGLAHSPDSYGPALAAATKSWMSKESLGDFIVAFDERALAAGRPTSEEWARSGLRFGASHTEYEIGQGLPGVLERLAGAPGIAQANRSFGTFGDVLRLEMADAMHAAGKSMEDVAESSNLISGWSKGRFMGDMGDIMQFAPRFFQSQLELLGHAIRSGGTKGAEARKSLLKMIGAGTLMTVAANEALGNNPEYNKPFDSRGKPNSNFMRIRVPGIEQDVSLFGPWDSLLRGMMAASRGDFSYMARTKASGLVGLSWDAITGETFTGGDFGPESIARGFLPFSISDIEPGRWVDAPLRELGRLGVGGSGLKASDVTPYEQMQQKWASDQDGRFSLELFKDEAETNPEYANLLNNWETSRSGPGADRKQLAQDVRRDAEVSLGLPKLAADFKAGADNGPAIIDAMGDMQTGMAFAMQAIYQDAGEGDSPDAKIFSQIAALSPKSSEYRDAEGIVDWDRWEADVAKLVEGLSPTGKKEYETHLSQSIDPTLREIEPQIREAKRLRGDYYDLDRWAPGVKNQDKIEEIHKEVDAIRIELNNQGMAEVPAARLYNEYRQRHPGYNPETVAAAYRLRSGDKMVNPKRFEFLQDHADGVLMDFFPELFSGSTRARIAGGDSSAPPSGGFYPIPTPVR